MLVSDSARLLFMLISFSLPWIFNFFLDCPIIFSLKLEGFPEGWDYNLKESTNKIIQMAIGIFKKWSFCLFIKSAFLLKIYSTIFHVPFVKNILCYVYSASIHSGGNSSWWCGHGPSWNPELNLHHLLAFFTFLRCC